jgi:hypothetical protein
MSTELHTLEQCAAVEKTGQRYRRMIYALALLIAFTGTQAVCAGTVLLVDYGLLFDGISYLKTVMPGQDQAEQTLSTHLLSLCGTVMLLGLHIRSENSAYSAPIRFIERSADVAIPLFSLGVGGLFAASLWFGGLDGLLRSSAHPEILSDYPDTAGTPFFNGLFSKFVLPLVFGAAGLGTVTHYCATHLIRSIRRNLDQISDQLFRVREGCTALRTIRACQQRFAALMRDRLSAAAVDERILQIEAAQEIVAARISAIAPYETWVMDETSRPASPEARFRTREFDFDLGEMTARINAERAVSAKHVLAVIRTGLR